jgi:hypothetical protein
MDDLIIQRLLGAVVDLLPQGLAPHEIEQRIFGALTAPLGPDLPARRARLFRVSVGLPPEPLSRGEASRLADAIGRALRGPRDPVFERRMLLAHLRGLLMQQAHDSAEELRRDNIDVTPENLRSALMFATVYARPRSELWPCGVSDAEVKNMIMLVVDDYFGESR